MYHKLKHHLTSGVWCRRVVAQLNVVIPSRSEVDLSARVVFKKMSDVGESGDVVWTTEPTRLADGVYVSRTVIPNGRFDDITVRVMNVKSESVIVRAGVNVDNLQPVEVMGLMQVSSSGNQQKNVLDGGSMKEGECFEFIAGLIEEMHKSMSESVKSATAEKLRQYSDVFSKFSSDLGITGVATHGIDTGDAAPLKQSMRLYPPAHLQAIDQHVDSMMSQGVIEPATSSWASNLVNARKTARIDAGLTIVLSMQLIKRMPTLYLGLISVWIRWHRPGGSQRLTYGVHITKF